MQNRAEALSTGMNSIDILLMDLPIGAYWVNIRTGNASLIVPFIMM